MYAWDARKAIQNYRKHGVPFEEAATVFTDADGLDWADREHSLTEPRRKRLGRSSENRLLLVVYTLRRTVHGQETIRVVSARFASRKERKAYSRPSD